MPINFFHPRLKPTIECNVLASEGYEISNLVSEDKELFDKGFLAERFVSGPVILTIKFICPINLKTIIIWPKIGSQRSIGFELSSLKSTDTYENDDSYSKFASGVSRNDVDTIIFHKEGSTNISPSGTCFNRTFFRSKNHEDVYTLRIKIFKAHFVSAIKKLEIWAEPSYTCDWKTKKHVRRLWWQISHQRSELEVSCFKDEPVHTIESFPNLDDAEIPEEFYDQITHEVMNLPVILPSGKVIDQRTLERCQKEEERWGRSPSDPFTGLVFTENCKPVVDTLLKSKIDEFLFKNANLDQIKYMPRRLGSNNESTYSKSGQYVVSKIVEKNSVECKRKLEENVSSSKKMKTHNAIESLHHNDKSEFIKSKSNDLHSMLTKTLSNLPSFLSAPKQKIEQHSCCVQCTVTEQLYRFPCNHILCRSCTIQKRNYCSICEKTFNFAEIHKIHLAVNNTLKLNSF